jgi:hypothetical protein
MTVKDAKLLDQHRNGGALVDGKLVQEYPLTSADVSGSVLCLSSRTMPLQADLTLP